MAKILIVEDEPNMRMGLKDNLEFEGYDIDVAVNGDEGLNKIKGTQFDLILLDDQNPCDLKIVRATVWFPTPGSS